VRAAITRQPEGGFLLVVRQYRSMAPAGYAAVRGGGAQVVALPSAMATVQAAIAAAGTLGDWAAGRASREFTGRGAAWAVETPDGTWVVRHYRRGGAIARLLGDRYLRVGEPRPLRELRASTAARAKGTATPEVVAAVVYPAGGFYRGDLATRYVPDSADLAEATLGPARFDAAGRIAAWRAAGALLRTAFDAGVEHADLNLRNILVRRGTDGDTTALLLDLDRASVHHHPLDDSGRAALLARLHRSRRKLEAALRATTGTDELAAFTAALEEGNG
jgi:3-deoxy-D-manno-octulosonic acid kinase